MESAYGVRSGAERSAFMRLASLTPGVAGITLELEKGRALRYVGAG